MPLRLRYPQPEPWPFWDELFGMNSGRTGERGEGLPMRRTPQDPVIPLLSWFRSDPLANLSGTSGLRSSDQAPPAPRCSDLAPAARIALRSNRRSAWCCLPTLNLLLRSRKTGMSL